VATVWVRAPVSNVLEPAGGSHAAEQYACCTHSGCLAARTVHVVRAPVVASPRDQLPAEQDHAEIDGVMVRRGSVAVFVAHATLSTRCHPAPRDEVPQGCARCSPR
jgi:hypothetical protein